MVDQAVTLFSLEQIRGSNLRPVKSEAVLPKTCYHCNISSKAVLYGRSDMWMGPANLLHAAAQYSEYNEKQTAGYSTVILINLWIDLFRKIKIGILIFLVSTEID